MSDLTNKDDNIYSVYSYLDHVIFPHTHYLERFWHHPSQEIFEFGLSKESKIWQKYPNGATFCHSTNSLHFEPSHLSSCLLEKKATLICEDGPKLLCSSLDGTDRLFIDDKVQEGINIAVAPFDYIIQASKAPDALNEACIDFKQGVFKGTSIKLEMQDHTILAEDGLSTIKPSVSGDARLVDETIKCGRPSHYFPDGTVAIGLLGTGLSFVYKPNKNVLEVYTTRVNSMRNDWPDVIVINICLLAFSHWLADKAKGDVA